MRQVDPEADDAERRVLEPHRAVLVVVGAEAGRRRHAPGLAWENFHLRRELFPLPVGDVVVPHARLLAGVDEALLVEP
jgi:hypothetical protein